MTNGDPELLRVLADADAERPVGPGVEFTPASLAAAAARRMQRRLVAAGAAVTFALLVFLTWPCRSHETDDDAAAVASLRADFDRLQRSLLAWREADSRRAADEEQDRLRSAAMADLREELAAARCEALAAALPSRTR